MRYFFLFITITLLLTSCDMMNCVTKDQFIESYTTFVDDIESKRQDGKVDWTSTDPQFKAYMNTCYDQFRDKLTTEEKKQVWKKTLKYYYNRFGTNFKEAKRHAKENFSDKYNEDLEEVLKNADEDIVELFSDLFKDDISKGIDSVLDIINDFGKKLKEELEEE